MQQWVLTTALCSLTSYGWAQSVITLDDFDYSAPAAPVASTPAETAAKSEMELCLIDPANCTNPEFRSGSSLSMEDVVNLNIVDHESVPTAASTNNATTSGTQIAASDPLPSIDIEILFDYNSDVVRDDQFEKLIALADMLQSDSFDGYRFVFLGHTDAKGSDSYNRELSTRRAESVARLVRGFGRFDSDRTRSKGLGFSLLKDVSDPLGPMNRRVQLLLVPR